MISKIHKLENIAILNVKKVDYRSISWNMTKNEAIRLNNFKLDNKGIL